MFRGSAYTSARSRSYGYTCTIHPYRCATNRPPAAEHAAAVLIDPRGPNAGCAPPIALQPRPLRRHAQIDMLVPPRHAERNPPIQLRIGRIPPIGIHRPDQPEPAIRRPLIQQRGRPLHIEPPQRRNEIRPVAEMILLLRHLQMPRLEPTRDRLVIIAIRLDRRPHGIGDRRRHARHPRTAEAPPASASYAPPCRPSHRQTPGRPRGQRPARHRAARVSPCARLAVSAAGAGPAEAPPAGGHPRPAMRPAAIRCGAGAVVCRAIGTRHSPIVGVLPAADAARISRYRRSHRWRCACRYIVRCRRYACWNRSRPPRSSPSGYRCTRRAHRPIIAVAAARRRRDRALVLIRPVRDAPVVGHYVAIGQRARRVGALCKGRAAGQSPGKQPSGNYQTL